MNKAVWKGMRVCLYLELTESFAFPLLSLKSTKLFFDLCFQLLKQKTNSLLQIRDNCIWILLKASLFTLAILNSSFPNIYSKFRKFENSIIFQFNIIALPLCIDLYLLAQDKPVFTCCNNYFSLHSLFSNDLDQKRLDHLLFSYKWTHCI